MGRYNEDQGEVREIVDAWLRAKVDAWEAAFHAPYDSPASMTDAPRLPEHLNLGEIIEELRSRITSR